MDDLISRSKLIEFANNHFGGVIDCNDIARFPTIDAEPVRHAENVTPTHPSDMFICGGCGFVCEITKLIYKDEDHPEVGPPEAFEYECEYCPHCGSKMDAKEA